MNIATVAMDVAWKDIEKNLAQTKLHVAESMRMFPKTQIILFPELSLTGFVVDAGNQEIAEPMDGRCVSEIQRIARTHKVALICGMIEQNPDGGKPYNTQFVVNSGGTLVAKHRKNHLFTQSAEPEVYTPGEELSMFEFDSWKCGLATCFDIRFPRLFATYKQAGAECIFAGFNWVEGRNKPAIMENLIKVRAHENQYYVVAVDRTGSDPNTSFYGTSIISNPYAENVAEHNGIYSYAEITKDDIENLGKLLPMSGSFKESYSIGS